MSINFGNGFVTTRRTIESPNINIENGFQTSNRTDHIMRNYNSRNNAVMKNVTVLPQTENVFTKAYEGIGDLSMSESQIMHNKVQEIIDSAARFNQTLKETAKNRHINVTDEEESHMNTDAIASSLSGVFLYKSALNPTVVDMDKANDKQ